MAKVICADLSCKYHRDNDTCSAKSISLSWHSVVTLHEGQQEFSKCKTKEYSNEYLEIEKHLAAFLQEKAAGR